MLVEVGVQHHVFGHGSKLLIVRFEISRNPTIGGGGYPFELYQYLKYRRIKKYSYISFFFFFVNLVGIGVRSRFHV